MTKTTTAKTRLLNYLNTTGATITVAQARSRFGMANPRARISELREDGHKIRTDLRRGRDGVARAVYSLTKTVARKSR